MIVYRMKMIHGVAVANSSSLNPDLPQACVIEKLHNPCAGEIGQHAMMHLLSAKVHEVGQIVTTCLSEGKTHKIRLTHKSCGSCLQLFASGSPARGSDDDGGRARSH